MHLRPNRGRPTGGVLFLRSCSQESNLASPAYQTGVPHHEDLSRFSGGRLPERDSNSHLPRPERGVLPFGPSGTDGARKAAGSFVSRARMSFACHSSVIPSVIRRNGTIRTCGLLLPEQARYPCATSRFRLAGWRGPAQAIPRVHPGGAIPTGADQGMGPSPWGPEPHAGVEPAPPGWKPGALNHFGLCGTLARGRDGRIRTGGLCHPKAARCQAAPHPARTRAGIRTCTAGFVIPWVPGACPSATRARSRRPGSNRRPPPYEGGALSG